MGSGAGAMGGKGQGSGGRQGVGGTGVGAGDSRGWDSGVGSVGRKWGEGFREGWGKTDRVSLTISTEVRRGRQRGWWRGVSGVGGSGKVSSKVNGPEGDGWSRRSSGNGEGNRGACGKVGVG